MEQETQERPSYYSVLPASVRYDKRLKANEKLLYSEIAVLCNKNGYCNARNEYFANLYEVHKNTISVWINNLKFCGYIGTKIVDKRIIFLSEIILREIAQNYCDNHEGGINDLIDRYMQNHLYPINENIEENNTSINNNKNNNKKEKSLFEIIEENYCRLLAPIEAEEIDSWEDTELTRYVIKETILKGIRNIKYISRILEDYKINNITTIEQAKDRDKQRKNNNYHSNNHQQEHKTESKWDRVRRELEEKKRRERA